MGWQRPQLLTVLRIREVYSGSRILDLGSRTLIQQQQNRVGKKFVVLPGRVPFCGHKFRKIESNFIFGKVKELPYSINYWQSLSSRKYRMGWGMAIRDPRSGRNLSRIQKHPPLDPYQTSLQPTQAVNNRLPALHLSYSASTGGFITNGSPQLNHF